MNMISRKVQAVVIGIAYFTLAGIASAASSDTLGNPLNPSFSTIPNFIAGALRVLVMLALPILTLMIVYSGFLFVFARGNQEKLGTAKTNLMYVLIGSTLILGTWIIATLISGTVSQLTTG